MTEQQEKETLVFGNKKHINRVCKQLMRHLFHSVQYGPRNCHVGKTWYSIAILRKFTNVSHDW